MPAAWYGWSGACRGSYPFPQETAASGFDQIDSAGPIRLVSGMASMDFASATRLMAQNNARRSAGSANSGLEGLMMTTRMLDVELATSVTSAALLVRASWLRPRASSTASALPCTTASTAAAWLL